MSELVPELSPVDEPLHVLMDVESYQREVAENIGSAQQRALVMTLQYRADHLTDPIVDGMCIAAKNGAKAILAVDSFAMLHDGSFYPNWAMTGSKAQEFGQEQAHMQEMADKLSEAGGTYRWTNKAGIVKTLFPGINTNHIKTVVIDDTVYLTGANFIAENLEDCTDFVLRVRDKELADQVERHLFVGDLPSQDQSVDLGEVGELLIDAGRGSSIIYDRVCELIEEERDVVHFLSRFAPTGRMQRALHAAKQNGADVEGVRIRQSDLAIAYKCLGALGIIQSRGLAVDAQSVESVKSHGAIHGKMVRVGDRLVSTSHNLTAAGVILRTSEIALIAEDGRLANGFSDRMLALK